MYNTCKINPSARCNLCLIKFLQLKILLLVTTPHPPPPQTKEKKIPFILLPKTEGDN